MTRNLLSENTRERTFPSMFGLHRPFSLAGETLAAYTPAADAPVPTAMQDAHRGTCFILGETTPEVIEALAQDDFRRTWKAFSATQREETILRSLRSIHDTYPEGSLPRDLDVTESMGFLCPDSSLQALTARGGDGLLDLAHAILPSDIDVIGSSYTYVPHPAIDFMIQVVDSDSTLASGLVATMIRCTRTLYLTILVLQIIRCTLSREFWKYPFRVAPIRRKVFASLAPQSGEQSLWGIAMGMAERRASPYDQYHRCFFCRKTQEGSAFKRCKPCATAGWHIIYCSRECQREDWTHGKPYPHKQVCGKDSATPVASVSQPRARNSDTGRIAKLPKPDNGYKRSPALLWQLLGLRQDRSLAYLVRDAEHETTHIVSLDTTFAEPQMKPQMNQFLAIRNRAFRNGEAFAVRALYAMLHTMTADDNLKSEERTRRLGLLRCQLEKEYGVAVDAAPIPLSDIPKPTPRELEELTQLQST